MAISTASVSKQTVSTESWREEMLPAESSNIGPGWHVVDIVWTSGFFSVYYDGHLYTSYHGSGVTGAALQVAISSAVAPDNGEIEQALGGPPINSGQFTCDHRGQVRENLVVQVIDSSGS
jgi:hypothetical protein